jgi:hypothetical protein
MTDATTRIREVLSHVAYKDWSLSCVTGDDGLYIEWKAPVRCVHTGNIVILSSRPRYLRNDITESELVRLAFETARDMELHELGENFRYKGGRVFNPHISVRHLLEICDEEDARAGA